MQIVVKRTKLFLLPVDNSSTLRHIAGRSGMPQEAPDWIRKTDTFAVGVEDGSIVELQPKKKAAPAPAKKPAAPPQKPAPPLTPATGGGDPADQGGPGKIPNATGAQGDNGGK